jgi:hypothetical protein
MSVINVAWFTMIDRAIGSYTICCWSSYHWAIDFFAFAVVSFFAPLFSVVSVFTALLAAASFFPSPPKP